MTPMKRGDRQMLMGSVLLSKRYLPWMASAVLLLSLHSVSPALGNESVHLEEEGFLLGWSTGELDLDDGDGHYEVIPLTYRLQYDVSGWLDNWLDLDLPGELDVALEPFVGMGTTPSGEFEVGLAAMAKFELFSEEEGRKVNPYVDLGGGFIYTTLDWEETTQYNLLLQGGLGIDFRLSDRGNRLAVGTRLRHYSNAGLNERNRGVNNVYLFLGYSWRSSP